MFRLKFFQLCTVTFLALLTTYAQCVVAQDTDFADTKLGISLQLPEGFTLERKSKGDVLFVARPNEGDFPTMTLVQQVGNPRVPERTASELRNDIVDSYRAVGFVDAESDYGEKRKLADRDVFFTKILYEHNKRLVAAGVFIFPAKERYFILTMINDREALPQTLPILEKVAKSVRLSSPPPSPEIQASKLYVVYWFAGALLLLLLIQGVWWLFSRKGASTK